MQDLILTGCRKTLFRRFEQEPSWKNLKGEKSFPDQKDLKS
jgi:hypothetical protein